MLKRKGWLTSICLVLSSGALAQRYFPDHAFHDSDNINNFVVRWYSEQLKALEEPSLWETSKASKMVEGYRFLWLRSFSNPVAVRVEVAMDGSGTVTAKVCNGSGGDEPGKLITNDTRRVSKEDIRKLLAKLDATDYWNLPSRDPKRRGNDGSEWTIAAVREGKYKLVNRWSPAAGAVRDLGLWLLQFSGLQIPDDDIY